SFGKSPSVEAVREALGLVGDERALQLARQALQGDLAGGLATIAAVRDDGLDLREFQKEVVLRLRALLHLQAGASAEGILTAEQAKELAGILRGVPNERTIVALRAFGTADLKTDSLTPYSAPPSRLSLLAQRPRWPLEARPPPLRQWPRRARGQPDRTSATPRPRTSRRCSAARRRSSRRGARRPNRRHLRHLPPRRTTTARLRRRRRPASSTSRRSSTRSCGRSPARRR